MIGELIEVGVVQVEVGEDASDDGAAMEVEGDLADDAGHAEADLGFGEVGGGEIADEGGEEVGQGFDFDRDEGVEGGGGIGHFAGEQAAVAGVGSAGEDAEEEGADEAVESIFG